MQSFPAVTSSDLTAVTSTTQTLHHQPEIIDGTGFDRSFMGKEAHLVFQPFPCNYHEGFIAVFVCMFSILPIVNCLLLKAL